MATINPDEGLEWFAERALGVEGAENEKIYSIAVGSGTTAVDPNDTQLAQEEYRGQSIDSNVVFTDTSPAIGEIQCRITISGGTEVPADTSITEFGVFARDPSIDESNVTETDDTLIHREVRSGITLESGDRKTFEFNITLVNN